MASDKMKRHQEQVKAILKYLNYTTSATAMEVTKVVYKSDSEAFMKSAVKPVLDAMVLTGQCEKSSSSHYSTAHWM